MLASSRNHAWNMHNVQHIIMNKQLNFKIADLISCVSEILVCSSRFALRVATTLDIDVDSMNRHHPRCSSTLTSKQ